MTVSKHSYRLFNDILTEVWVEIGDFIVDGEAGESTFSSKVCICTGSEESAWDIRFRGELEAEKGSLKIAVVREGHSQYPNLNQVGTLGDK